MTTQADSEPQDAPLADVLQRRLAREQLARRQAESIAESATRKLYDTVQELTRSTRLAELLGEVAVRANEATTVEEALRTVLDSVCDHIGWPVGHALLRSETDPQTLVSLGIWRLPEAGAFAAFRAASEPQAFPSGRGLPGLTMSTGVPTWIADLSLDSDFQRAESAKRCGLVSGFALPILVRSETCGVLEFFATSTEAPDAALLRVAAFVGVQLGRVLERQESEDRLRRLALYDSLTGLPNRLLLMDRLQLLLRRAWRIGARIDVLYLDLDDFKMVNDRLGHSAADDLLATFASRLVRVLNDDHAARDADRGMATVATVARLEGDEFAIMLQDCPDPGLVVARIETLYDEPVKLPDGEVFLSVSIGSAPASDADRHSTGEALLARAALAMHEAKRKGKRRFQTFEPRLYERAQRRHQLGEELRKAVSTGEFEVAYQPVVRLADGRQIGAEALVRWRHPVSGLVPPDEFIPRAEETGLIVQIGAWMLLQACQQAAKWRAIEPDFSMALNVSGRQLRESTFPALVRDALAAAGLPPQNLCLEMTESILMERDDAGIAMLAELRSDGVHLAIDDFGTGYSSLAALRRLPADQLKIDRSFVSSLPGDDDAGTIAWAVVRLGHTLGMSVLAEGVETPQQRDVLLGFGCDSAQGWLFGRPCSAELFEQGLGQTAS